MTKPEIISEAPMNLSQVKNELTKIEKRDGELNFRANKTIEHLNQLHVLPIKKAKDLESKLVALDIPRLKDIHIYKIIDLLPKTLEDLKILLQGYTLTVKQDNQKKIISTVKEFL